jgi:primosomal protein N'
MLQDTNKLDALARSRCLLVLSVLSGATPVTEAVAQAKISHNTYYKLETRALHAMLAGLNPLSGASANGATDQSLAVSRIAELEAKVQRLEQDRRRLERLLLLTRKTLRAPLLTGHRGRWPKALTAGASMPMSPGASSP